VYSTRKTTSDPYYCATLRLLEQSRLFFHFDYHGAVWEDVMRYFLSFSLSTDYSDTTVLVGVRRETHATGLIRPMLPRHTRFVRGEIL
jgi:hypothetical protein